MNPLVKTFLQMLAGPITGFASTYLMDFVDDILKWTANWPNVAKQAMVIVLTTALPLIAQATGITLPSDPSQLATQPVVQSIVAAAFAFFLKHVNDKTSAVVPPVPAVTK